MNDISYINFVNKNIILNKFKLPEIKNTCRKFKLKVTGNKPVLIERIVHYFENIKNCIIIQKYIRRWLVYRYFLLKGSAFNNLKLCVNDTDFTTLEPLKNISFEYIFTFTDNKDFTYAFNIVSLINYFKHTNKKFNPYNRTIFNIETIKNIYKCYNLTYILFESFRKSNPKIIYQNNKTRRNYRQIGRNQLRTQSYNPTLRSLNSLNNLSINRYNNLIEIRNNSINRRIISLFMEMDQLGNYTNYEWFSQLSYLEYRRLYRTMYELWNFRLNLTPTLQRQICPYHCPFQDIFANSMYPYDVSEYDIKVGCLILFENLIYSGINEELRKLGALYTLTALTIVSESCRNTYPFLYESLNI